MSERDVSAGAAGLIKAALRWVVRAGRVVLTVVAAIVLLIEEWGWRPLTAMAARLARWPPLARLEDRIRATSPRVALSLFMVPASLLFPIKLLALWLVHRHHAWLGVALIVAAKLLGTALVGRLFIVCEPQLSTFPWFVRALAWWRATKERIKRVVAESAVMRSSRKAARWCRTRGRRWWRGYHR